MKRCLFAMLIPLVAAAVPSSDSLLRYEAPANPEKWASEALPLGNGRLGCMLFGDPAKTRILFNEDTLWIGDEQRTGAYQKFGDVFVETGHESVSDYRRELDLSNALHVVEYVCEGVRYRREAFAADRVLVFRFSANRKGACNAVVSLAGAHGETTEAKGRSLCFAGNLRGFLYKDERKAGLDAYDIALDCEADLLVLPEGGAVAVENGRLVVRGADAFVILLAAGTDFLQNPSKGWKGAPPRTRLRADLRNAAKKGYDRLLAEHETDWRESFSRLELDWGTTPEKQRNLPTDQRIAAYRAGAEDPDLEELVFRFARYLMRSSSRKGGLPANLQGVWNDSNDPPWRCDFHSDVNVEMNYWFVDAANLSECFAPFSDWLRSIHPVRVRATRTAFGKRGWLTRAENGPFGGSTWQWSKGDAAWMLQNLFDHYRFTLDRDYLESVYPLMKSQCEFWVDDLKELPDGTLVSPDGYSPEHGPREDGVSFDQQLVRNLFENYLRAAKILRRDPDFAAKIGEMQRRLLGPKIGKWGQLQEWMVDRDDPNDTHRHLSHMIALHPGRQISPRTTPALAKAASVSLDARGDGSTGWSKAWKINLRARLHEGDHARKLIREFIANNLYDNLFGFHPPFQIDCNFGYASGLLEMLLQSHLDYVDPLPALPSDRPNGQLRGVKARGAFVLNLEWKNGRIRRMDVFSEKGIPFRIFVGTKRPVVTCEKRRVEVAFCAGVARFPTAPGKRYRIDWPKE